MRATLITLALVIATSIALTIGGFAASAPAAIIPSFLCGMPLVAFLIGRLSMMIEVVPKQSGAARRERRQAPASSVLN